MAALFVREAPARKEREEFRITWRAIRRALAEREIWVVGGFIFFWTFSPSFGPALLYYQTDVLHFSQQFIGHLGALSAAAGVVGALIYAPLSRLVPLKRLINLSIGVGVVGTLAYLLYGGPLSALIIDVVFGCVGMPTRAVPTPGVDRTNCRARCASVSRPGKTSERTGGRLRTSCPW